MEDIIQPVRQKLPADTVIFGSCNDERDSILQKSSTVYSKDSNFRAARAKYSNISKILIVIGTLGVQFNINYHSMVYSAIAKEFDEWYICTHKVFFYSTQIFVVLQIIFNIPGSFLFSRFLKVCVWLTVFTSILGASIKFMAPNNIIVFYIGQSLIVFSTLYAYIATPAVGSLIFDTRNNQLFQAWSYTLPMVVNIVVIIFPPFLIGNVPHLELIPILHTVGFGLSFLTIPLLFVDGDWKISKVNWRENHTVVPTHDYLDNSRFPNVANMDKLSQALRTRVYWICIVIYIIFTPMMCVLVFDYPLYLQLYYITEKKSAIHAAGVFLIGMLSTIFLNTDSNVFRMCKILLILESLGMIVIGISSLYIKPVMINKEFSTLMPVVGLLFGEILLGIGVIGNVSFTIMSVIRLFP